MFMKSGYGVTPWGSWFIDVLDSYQMGTRLDRGRRYANAGRVLSLEFSTCSAVAKVEGNYLPFYRVQINFPPLKEAEQVYRMIEEDPPLLARIAAGELPETFLQKLKDKGINLIPGRWEEMERSCTCPDWGDPCKHMAALYYIIAREIDANPHILFKLRGMDLAARFGTTVVHSIEPPFIITFAQRKNDSESPEQTPPEIEMIPQCGELITSLLPPAPSFCGRDFAAVMAEFYRRIAVWETVESKEKNKSVMEHNFSRSRWTVLCPKNVGPGAEPVLQAEDINGGTKRYSVYGAFERFVHFSSEDGTASYSFLFYLFKFLNLVCTSGAFIPYVFEEDKKLKVIWRPFENLPPVPQMLESLAAYCPASRENGMFVIPAISTGGQKKTGRKAKGQKTRPPRPGPTVSGQSVVDLLSSAFLSEWVKRSFTAFCGTGGGFGGQGDPAKPARDEYRELLNLFFQGAVLDISSPARHSLPAAIDRWLSVFHTDFSAYRYSMTVKDLSKKKDAPDNISDALEFALSMDVLVDKEDGIARIPLSKCSDLMMLRAPMALSNYLPEIQELASPQMARRQAVNLSEERLVSFLDSSASLLSRLGITVNLPKALHKELKPRLVITGNFREGSLVQFLDLNTLQDFEWQIAIGDKVLDLAEFEKLLKEKRALVRFRDGFIKINPEEFARLLKRTKNARPNFNDFLKAHFSGDTILDFDASEAINKLFKERNFPIPRELAAKLRPYQKRGYNWVCSLLYSGFGCILADDMGLGKTVQSIAALLRLKEEGILGKISEGYHSGLIVAPAALLTNWEKELSRFAPSLSVSRYHGSGRRLDKGRDVFLTTYQTAVRDAEKLQSETFSLLLVDEAHLMKNAETLISKTIKQIRCQYRLALSGTPVENRLEDLRSLFDFILPGYLGSPSNFREQYRVPIEVMRDRGRAESLRKVTAPFLMRRLKTDKTIIRDLPEKIVTNEYAVLEKGQAALYESVVDESIRKSLEADPDERSALILSMLTTLKQICDHPRVFDKESPAVSQLSGKARLLLTLLQEILANREKTLIFSQYVETLYCLEQIIRKELGEAPLLYYGGLNQTERAGIVNRFQDDPAARIMLVSLKAGGLGLNLTAASRVIHYDLWYNPAVENQATDRAFRIGQQRTVFVHRFITKNSFEEKIDEMIANKKELADMTVASGESWIARMSHEELKALFER